MEAGLATCPDNRGSVRHRYLLIGRSDIFDKKFHGSADGMAARYGSSCVDESELLIGVVGLAIEIVVVVGAKLDSPPLPEELDPPPQPLARIATETPANPTRVNTCLCLRLPGQSDPIKKHEAQQRNYAGNSRREVSTTNRETR